MSWHKFGQSSECFNVHYGGTRFECLGCMDSQKCTVAV